MVDQDPITEEGCVPPRRIGSPDFRDDGNGFRERVGAGRKTLPLDEARFTALGKSPAEWWG
ncbi:hypothetical protein [Actinosynnema pretiosum]|uniref:Uncharacterized protein n=1 Tax=Actinosynnema pretiosum TaxID=42197 RepID=A0A290ZBA9_9PSEU|nr:hypothetical protein [Actinosynnema pretiosum]ATE56286.1 hypothetical protein CNX65_25945 [Actinosynnema pretiosum]